MVANKKMKIYQKIQVKISAGTGSAISENMLGVIISKQIEYNLGVKLLKQNFIIKKKISRVQLTTYYIIDAIKFAYYQKTILYIKSTQINYFFIQTYKKEVNNTYQSSLQKNNNMDLSSSLSLTTKTPLEKQQLKKLKTIWQNLFDNNDSVEFRIPVDWQAFGLLDYPKIIKKPMDLGTVDTKLKQGEYLYVEEMLDDIQLIWDNCKLYNLPGSWIYNLADKLQKNFKKMLKNYLSVIPFSSGGTKVVSGKDSAQAPIKKQAPSKKAQKKQQVFFQEGEQQISYDQKIKFSEKLKMLSPQSLGLIVQKIMSVCPTAFKQIQQEKAQIYLDNIDNIAFNQILQYADELSQLNGLNGPPASKKIKTD